MPTTPDPRGSVLPYVYQIMRFDPLGPDGDGRLADLRKPFDDREAVPAAYLAAVAAFADANAVDQLTIDNPMIDGFFRYRWATPGFDDFPSELWPAALGVYYDGAQITLAAALGLVQAMLRGQALWCRLVVPGRFFVHVGYDGDLYIGSIHPCESALAVTREQGLFARKIDASPFDPRFDEYADPRPADKAFWAEVCGLADERGAVLIEEVYVGNGTHWHRVTPGSVDAVRDLLAPRARVNVWPDLTADMDVVRAALRSGGVSELLLEARDGHITSRLGEPRIADGVAGVLAGVRAAAVLPFAAGERRPLLAGVLPDGDGVVRACWRINRTRADDRRAFLMSLQRGEVRTGTVTSIHNFGVFVDIGGVDGLVRVPELSWTHVDHASEVVEVGQVVDVEVLAPGLDREQPWLSLKGAQPDPWMSLPHQVGDTVPAQVTKLMPFGAFARVADGIEGLIHLSELADGLVERPEDVVRVGDEIRVKLMVNDVERRRLSLSLKRAGQPRYGR